MATRMMEDILKQRPVILDGAMGTTIEARGRPVASCNEELCLSRPEFILDIHREYIKAGSDVILTNTFGGSRISLADHGLTARAAEINRGAARIARRAADEAGDAKRLVAGDLGPTSKLPTLSQISFDEMFDAYREQVAVLLDGGVDMILIETCQDPFQMKSALAAANDAIRDSGRRVPVFVSVTVEKTGTMLLGTELSAALVIAAGYRPYAFGINCATGPKDMEENLRYLSGHSPFHILCEPNAGMPEVVDGKASYTMCPDEFGEIMAEYSGRFGLAFVGGCCGTTPDHIAALSKRVKSKRIAGRNISVQLPASAASLFTSVAFDQEPRPFIVAEQTNVNGSKKYRDLLAANDYESMADVARDVSKASHALDICLAVPGRSELKDFDELVRLVAMKADVPMMIDSTDPDAMESALRRIPGRAIINSINFEDGGAKAKRILRIARRHGAAVVGLTIDEDGMAKTCERKIDIAKRLLDFVSNEGLGPDDIFMDVLTFTLASGDPSLYGAGFETLLAIERIKKEMRGVRTILGVSNISYGLTPKGRRILTSVFLNRAIDAGLDAAIINPSRIVPLANIDGELLKICNRIIDGDRNDGDPLAQFIKMIDVEGGRPSVCHEAKGGPVSPRDALRARIVEGSKAGLQDVIEGLIASGVAPADVINEILMPAMQDVGKLFGGGRLPLPFVLESAESMRAAIDLISPHMKGSGVAKRGTIVIATVRGDVHDIGKNLVDAILANNGFRVVNLGIRQPATAIIDAAIANKADAIGLSGLLVSSTEAMREDLVTFRQMKISIPVLCGGAALTESFVKKTLAPTYGATILYCADAFAGLAAMEEIASRKK